jgi:protein-L-isoaspartate(D-aspartate) O-methyltransferase
MPDHVALPLGEGRMIPPVDVAARMLRALDLQGSERVLDIGGGSGYVAALLSRLAHEVVSVEPDEELVRRATSTLTELGVNNVRVVHAKPYEGWPEDAPYQAIIVEAAAAELPPALVEQLELGGRLVIPLGDADAQLISCLHKRVDSLDSKTIGACRLGMLPNGRRRPSFFPWVSGRRTG